ncbi:MAG: aminotransferase [Rhodobacteraceae bacterium]|nr:MAG: aminotransferase [Paracoccaceae bacterium]
MPAALPAPFSPTLAAAFDPPVMEARRWVAGRTFPADRPLINLSQAAPVDPPPEPLRRAIAEAALDRPEAHLYGPVLGDDALRAAIAERWSALYGGEIAPASVAATSGCNQAFCAAVATLAAPGEAVILPTPWYFNHKMWLDMAGVRAVPLPCGPDGLPDPERAAALIDPSVRALTLVTPNNPTGAEYPPALLDALFDLCRARGIGLILDETYRDFLSEDRAPHGLFAREGWSDTLIHLYSFSKVFRLTGHRVGALVAGAARIAQAEKFLDTVTICPSRLGQIAALYGLDNLGDWVAGERAEILARRAALEAGFAEGAGGFRLRSCGAYFAFLEHGFDAPSDVVAQRLVVEQSLLVLPGTMFAPLAAAGGTGDAERTLRLAFANADAAGLAETLRRLRAFRL